jgi:hypothetical protein
MPRRESRKEDMLRFAPEAAWDAGEIMIKGGRTCLKECVDEGFLPPMLSSLAVMDDVVHLIGRA